ncbi:SpoIID/LytB domain-containing protein [Bacteroidales bacterium OttesenSCG-928-M06]|nr:SpoIID/LytB domain-containing protein [Bacteroidales bacterium OttesenSCG-928-M06]
MKQPEIHVGIITADELHIRNNPHNRSFIIQNVPIGIHFHWEREEDQEFKGELKLIHEDNKLTAINIIPIEDYLESVISSEMSATSFPELLKAHAVISRSWLLAQKEKTSLLNQTGKKYNSISETENEYIRWYDREDHKNYDVCADDHCQRYQGITKASTPAVKEAIANTFGEVLMYDGKICDTRFSKCCGGVTEQFENCWEPVPHPYLESVEDTFCNTNDQEVLKQVLNNYDQETHDFYRWTVSYSGKEISRLIRDKSGWDFGDIIDLIPIELGASGRITKLKIIGTSLTKTVGKELFIRKILSETHLYSSAFEIEKIYEEKEDIPKRFILHGSGWGHGVGLCQIGAAMMAKEGYSYKEILAHYFKKSQLKKIY